MKPGAMESVPDLTAGLREVEALRKEQPAACSGSRRWWGGGLDVEGLALGSVQSAATALNALTGSPGRYSVDSGLTAASFDSLGHLRIAGRTAQGFAPASGFRRTADGWIRLHANYPHHAARLMEALSATVPQDVDNALLSMTSLEAETAIVAHKGAAAAVRSREAWVSSPMHSAASSGPWISLTPSNFGSLDSKAPSWTPSADPPRPLDGLKVLDLTRVIAGPTSTRLLGALGADVLRIDPPLLPELSDAFIDAGFDKRSAEADPRKSDDLAAVHALVASADVVITGYRAGGLDKFGLAPDALLAARPDLVVVTLTAWGSSGPWTGRRGFDSLVQAACGIAERYGQKHDDGWKPGALPVQALDHATGYGLAAAVLALLAERSRTGAGGSASLSLARTAEELFAVPSGYQGIPVSSLREPNLLGADSPYGQLTFVGPPLLVEGVPLSYRQPPVPYGTSTLAWR
ncbi:putative acyl-CoA transferase, CAIB/BAIF family [Paenarthrobacter aurescens TC1]|uniref:Acyl-CoA transferase, CAIB/BAIF family n=2 Tax=Paenarthrobacter aurescens TaxID=43663 RepID=A1R6F8_PAEAT|nr:putative acyl-CoA transferase, CAIB/BAIF family [Paenarthrobacter aurescens TC1]